MKQCKFLLWREIKTTLRDPQMYKMRFITAIAQALIFSIIYYQIKNECNDVRSRYGFLYLCTGLAVTQGLVYNCFSIPLSKHILETERISCQMYSTTLWALIKSFTVLPQLWIM
eukprot:433622_1